MTYFRMGNPHYHRRGVVSLSCSGWEGVGPTRYGRQTNCSANRDVLRFALSGVAEAVFRPGQRTVFGRSKFFWDLIAALRNASST
jgi:hypothetical protein